MTYKVHLDGYNLMPALKGEAEWPRKEFLYWTDDGNVAALRYNNWKITFLETERRWASTSGPAVRGAAGADARESADGSVRASPRTKASVTRRWWVDHMFVIAPAGAYVGKWLQSFRDFPPRQKPGSFNLERVMEAIAAGAGDK